MRLKSLAGSVSLLSGSLFSSLSLSDICDPFAVSAAGSCGRKSSGNRVGRKILPVIFGMVSENEPASSAVIAVCPKRPEKSSNLNLSELPVSLKVACRSPVAGTFKPWAGVWEPPGRRVPAGAAMLTARSTFCRKLSILPALSPRSRLPLI